MTGLPENEAYLSESVCTLLLGQYKQPNGHRCVALLLHHLTGTAQELEVPLESIKLPLVLYQADNLRTVLAQEDWFLKLASCFKR